MDCKKFNKYIDEYFTDPDFDWELKDEMDAHYFECDNCFATYQIASLMTDSDIKKKTIEELCLIQIEKAKILIKQDALRKAHEVLLEAHDLDPTNDEIQNLLKHLYKKNSLIHVIADGVIESIELVGKKIQLQKKVLQELIIKVGEKEILHNQKTEFGYGYQEDEQKQQVVEDEKFKIIVTYGKFTDTIEILPKED